MTNLRAALFLSALLTACSQPVSVTDAPESPGDPVVGNEFVEGVFPTGFLEATTLADVPGELLIAIANAETSLQMIVGEVEFEGQEPSYGVMGLPESLVAEAAALSGFTEDEVRYERVPNVVATATLLQQMADDLGLEPTRLGEWAPVVAAYSGIEDEEGVAEYVHYEVYATIEAGLELEGLELKPQTTDPDWPRPARDGNRTGDSSTVWTPSPNHNSRGGVSPSYVVIHTCEGSYSGCWSWLRNPNAGVSAHYVVNTTGSEVRQLVDEDRRAWHIGAQYDCSRNSNVDCHRNGASTNTHSIGIEHAGYASQTSWNSGMIDRSAALTCGITERHDIPIDAYHIFGHGQMQPWSRTDPGANWPWASYLNKIEQACGASQPPSNPGPGNPTPPPTSGVPFVIDSNNAANTTSQRYVQVSSSWWSSANVSGHYNTGYWVGATQSVSDPASFWFQTSGGAQCYRVEAWWPAAGDRPTAITWLGYTGNDVEVGRATVNQRLNGSRWNELGRWTFQPGWNRILLSRWASPGTFAIADAVRLTPTTGCN